MGMETPLHAAEGPVKPLLVGEANPYGADPAFALNPLPEHASGGRLARILGLSRGDYLRIFDRRNLCPTTWSVPVARREAEAIMRVLGRDVVLLGSKVAQAFGLRYEPFTTRGRLHLLPHPSGLSRAWNDPESIPRARALLAGLLSTGR